MKVLRSWRVLAGWTGLLAVVPLPGHEAGPEMAAAAAKFLEALSAEQRAHAVFPLQDEERFNWHFIPRERKGLPIREMTPVQRRLAQGLLASGLSLHGYDKATNIMSLETILRDLEGPASRFSRDPELYFFSVFGVPAAGGTWGWRVEGHHLSVNLTIVKGQAIAATPSFFGANPAEVREGPRRGLRVLAEEEDLARQLLGALDDEQRRRAVISGTAPRDIITGARRKVHPLGHEGVPAGRLTEPQRDLLLKLIETYVRRHRTEVAEADLARIRQAGLEKIYFAWAGSQERGQGHYYRVQGPTFLLEYDNTQNNANHIHCVWRDFENDFGEDILRRHYEQVPHP